MRINGKQSMMPLKVDMSIEPAAVESFDALEEDQVPLQKRRIAASVEIHRHVPARSLLGNNADICASAVVQSVHNGS